MIVGITVDVDVPFPVALTRRFFADMALREGVRSG